jgi:hypothetical protein
MASTFDTMYLPGGNTSQYDSLDLDGPLFPMTDNGTISPQDMYLDDSAIMSAPPSTVFPNLSTPGSTDLESPAMASSGLNTTPLLDGLLDSQLNFDELEGEPAPFAGDSWGQYDDQLMPVLPGSQSQSSFSAVNSHPAPPMQRQSSGSMERQKSSPGRPPSQPYHNRKRSDTAGINKAARPRKPLPEITVESDDDSVTAKRKKNTAAARKSRQRKQEHAELADAMIQRLRQEVIRLGGDPDSITI